MDITIVLPVHNERDNLRPLLEEIEQALSPIGQDYEVIAVDDGSNDGSGRVLRELAAEKRFLKVLVFRQNYGQSAAFDAGFRHATGRFVVTMDADLQNDPRDIPRMIDLIEREGYDFAAGRREGRLDGWLLRRLPSAFANAIIRRVTGTRLRDLGCSLKVYRRELTDELRLYGEMHRFIGVLVEGLGARTVEVPVHHRRRTAGQSKYGLTRVFKVLLDLLTVWFMRGYQTKPIYIFGGIGLVLGFASVGLSGLVLYQKLYNGVFVHRNPLFTLSMMLSVVAVQFLALGLLAEIVVRTYFESQRKAAYLIGDSIGFGPGTGATDPDAAHDASPRPPLVVTIPPTLRKTSPVPHQV
jgi:glycosyltransferase involved in cell wall biosynthesis